ncbi:hypothetical protein RDV89_07895 [Nocardioides zeae]|uniref:Uncharacterized protein n=1 Tax=Nocardioides imazamoxiresistens TaxID=3231893 RepID=A0ABU3PVT5_9ACTN|nr:hypothetical protein [Nocardioides zeae]MDT9592986.1 hypothetical protein [Nocardioides zeae]
MGRPSWKPATPVRSDEFPLPMLPEPLFLQVYARSPAGTPAGSFRYRLELRERRRVLGLPWWPRLVAHDEVGAGAVRDAKARRRAVAAFLQRLVAEGHVEVTDLPARYQRPSK